MIESKNFLYIIKLGFVINFFIFSFSQFLLTYSINLSYFLQNTFLETFNHILNNSLFTWAFIILRAISIFFIIGCAVGMLIILYYDIYKGQRLN